MDIYEDCQQQHDRGERIPAIKRLRAETGCSLVQAVEFLRDGKAFDTVAGGMSLYASRGTLIAEIDRITSERDAALATGRHEGRVEALNAVFQINGPSRAIAQLKKKWGIDQ